MNIIIRALVAGIVAVIAMFLIDIFKVERGDLDEGFLTGRRE